MRFDQLSLILVAIVLFHSSTIANESAMSDEDMRYFERKIRPILVERCYACHSEQAKTLHAGLRLDTREGIYLGGDNGPTVLAGKPDASLLIQSIHYAGELQMPPKGKLPDAEIRALTEWVERGAPFPHSQSDDKHAQKKIDFEKGRRFWSFQPARDQPLPANVNTCWSKNRLDHFIMSALEREGLQPTRAASPATLIRRLSFDLIGLPPSPEQVRSFEADPSPVAYQRLIDDLLSSPQYGVKWARTWLDLARYADKAESWVPLQGQSHFYRDWVVDSLNDDMPYDEFVRRQLATDLMHGTKPEDLSALGFIGLSPTYWKELQLPSEVIKVIVADEWEERVDAVCSTFLGLTAACARCHDHKFDPISSADYYALAGVVASSRQIGRPLVSEELYAPARHAKEVVAKLETELNKLKTEITKRKNEKKKEENAASASTKPSSLKNPEANVFVADDELLQRQSEELTSQIDNLKKTPLYDTPLASALSEESLVIERAGEKPENGTKLFYRPGPQDLPLFIRGDPNRPSHIVPRRFLTVLANDHSVFQSGSGRLELANAITTDAASLVARVMVNRVWLAHFGQGIVSTPSNFGKQGEPPTHPELLEDLSARFIAHGWSIKWLHREILHSATWQQSVEFSEHAQTMDPSNRWLSHFNRRRNDFEAWRDLMLTASGAIDLTQGGISTNLDTPGNRRRTLFCTVHRSELSTTFQIHDFPDPIQHSPQRFSTTTALQALYALNGPLLVEMAQMFLARLERECPNDECARIDRAHWLLYSRSASPNEKQLGLDYIGGATGDERTIRWKQYLHALLASNEALFLD